MCKREKKVPSRAWAILLSMYYTVQLSKDVTVKQDCTNWNERPALMMLLSVESRIGPRCLVVVSEVVVDGCEW